ncbi:MAG: flagellar biosynthesis anti-sigma factor FlgM [Gemmatimonadetes bacterium]|nr:flagellar biosynthesis anti-sigma factor FlgM [Gemmatimonadota bacterium]
MSTIRPVQPTEISPSESRSIRGGQEVDAPARATTNGSSSQSTSAPRDRVELSAEGRALARASSLDAGRVDSIRQKVLTGAYDSLGVMDQVARRILSRGDV